MNHVRTASCIAFSIMQETHRVKVRMKNMKATNYAIVCFFIGMVLVLSSGCGIDSKDMKYAIKRHNIEKNTPPFDPSYFKQEERRHLAIFFDVNDGQLVLSDRSAQVRPSRMPYRSPTAGDTVVVYRNAEGKQLGRYATFDPLIIRSCDLDAGRIGANKRMRRGTVEILIPYEPKISILEIGPKGGKLISFNVSSQIKAGLKLPR